LIIIFGIKLDVLVLYLNGQVSVYILSQQ